MEEFEPKKRLKIFNKEFIAKYSYVLVIAVLLIGGISYSYTFFTQNRKIASGSITTANLTINFTDRTINATNLSAPANDKEGLVEFTKSVTITNQTSIDGRVKLTLTRTSGLELTDLRYALVINGAIQEINDVPTNGVILSSAIMGSEVINVEIRLWPKTTYSGSATTFVGELTPEIKYLGSKATTSINSPAGKYVNFNCSSTCEVWQIVKVENDRLVLTRQSDYSGATSRTNSNKYDVSLTFNDNSMITSVSTDGKNVYLARTVKIDGGSGTQTDPYILVNNDFREPDKKVIAVITYKDGTETVGTQNVYYNETNYISQVIDDPDFTGWTDGTNNYELGDVVNFTVDITLNAIIKITAISVMKRNVDTVTQINFANPSSSSNGQGLYILPGTESDTHPIYYYRGAVDNNNVLFGGFCWQMVRTTETGGIKMIYNGLPDIEGSGDNITYNCGTTRDIQDTIRSTTSLSSSTGYYYADDYEIVSTSGNSVTYRLKQGTNPITQVAIADATAASTNIPTIASSYPYTCKQTTDSATCTTLYKVDSYASRTDANVYSSIDRPIIGKSAFNSTSSSVSDIGYMSNTRYPYSYSGWETDALFASTATWVTDHYELTDASVTTPDTTHHYSCNATTSDATCTSLRYVYSVSGTTKLYITLTSGDLVEDALYKMTGNGSVTTKTKNNGYVLNQNNSTVKTAIDNWFRINLTSEVDANNPDYSIYLEDTVYCNDRSFKTTGSDNTYSQSGWNPTNGSLSTSLSFGTYNRFSNSWYSTSNVPAVKNTGEVPNIACPNETDRFTVSNINGNGALTYPVGLLTADEIILAGVGGNNSNTSNYYLYTNGLYWSLAPCIASGDIAIGFLAYDSLSHYNVDTPRGLRPVVSLKSGTEFEIGGDGTGTNPYVVKYE